MFLCICQLDTLKYTVDRTARDLESARHKHNLLKKEVTNRTERYILYIPITMTEVMQTVTTC